MTAMYNKITAELIDQASLDMLALMGVSDTFDKLQPIIQDELGRMKASATGCGCVRPISCGTCRTEVEEGLYWNDRVDDLLQEAIQDDLDNEPIN